VRSEAITVLVEEEPLLAPATYKIEWIWQAERKVLGINKEELIANLENEFREKLLEEKGISVIHSIKTTNVQYWVEWLGAVHFCKGTTTAIVTSNPLTIAAITAFITKYVVPAIIVILVALFAIALITISLAVMKVAEEAPMALTLGAAALLLLVVFAFLPRLRKPKEVKEGET